MSKSMSFIIAVVVAVPAFAYAQTAPGSASSDVDSGGISTNGIGPGGSLIAPGLAPAGGNIDQVESGVRLAPGPAGQLSGTPLLSTPRSRGPRR
jgi:hypothetical protein